MADAKEEKTSEKHSPTRKMIVATGGLSSGRKALLRNVDEMLEEKGCQATENG